MTSNAFDRPHRAEPESPDELSAHMKLVMKAHASPLPPIWDLLDCQPQVETLHFLNLEEFTDLVNGCAPDAQ